MRTLSTILLAILFLFAGCKKENQGNAAPKTYLIKTITYTTPPLPNASHQYFQYDDKNRVTVFEGGGFIYKYTYDDNNNLVVIKNYDQSGNLISTNNLTYSSDEVDVKTTDVNDNGGSPYIFKLNSLGQVSSSSIDGTQQFTYDNKGNLTAYTQCCQLATSDSYTYDTKKNPLSMIGAKNFHLMFVALGAPTTFINNVVNDNAGTSYSYVYNADGFPVSATATSVSLGYSAKITYDYMIR